MRAYYLRSEISAILLLHQFARQKQERKRKDISYYVRPAGYTISACVWQLGADYAYPMRGTNQLTPLSLDQNQTIVLEMFYRIIRLVQRISGYE